jgi:hypothetical protein
MESLPFDAVVVSDVGVLECGSCDGSRVEIHVLG